MSWMQQLVGKLKSLFGRKSEQDGAALAPATPETPADKPAVDEKPAEVSPVATGEPAEAPVAEGETPAAEATSVTEEPAEAEVEIEVEIAVEPVATPAATAEVAVPEAVVAEPAEAPVASAADVVEPAAEDESAPAVEAAPEAKREATNPAISTLDVEGITAELQAEGPYGPGSSKPAAGGAAPSEDFTVKGKESSKLFHTEKSPYFSRTKADVWFKSEADAESAGFQAWDHKKRAATKK